MNELYSLLESVKREVKYYQFDLLGRKGMDRTGIYNYQVQVKEEDGRCSIQGAQSFKEAKELLFIEAQRVGSVEGYIWPQTKSAEKKINSLGLRSMSTVDYLKITLKENTAEKRHYITEGMKVGEAACAECRFYLAYF